MHLLTPKHTIYTQAVTCSENKPDGETEVLSGDSLINIPTLTYRQAGQKMPL